MLLWFKCLQFKAIFSKQQLITSHPTDPSSTNCSSEYIFKYSFWLTDTLLAHHTFCSLPLITHTNPKRKDTKNGNNQPAKFTFIDYGYTLLSRTYLDTATVISISWFLCVLDQKKIWFQKCDHCSHNTKGNSDFLFIMTVILNSLLKL